MFTLCLSVIYTNPEPAKKDYPTISGAKKVLRKVIQIICVSAIWLLFIIKPSGEEIVSAEYLRFFIAIVVINICALYLPIVVFGYLGCDKQSDYFDIDQLTMAYITKEKEKSNHGTDSNMDAYKEKLYGNTVDNSYKDDVLNDEVENLVDRKH